MDRKNVQLKGNKMALVTSYTVKKDRNSMAGLSAYENGGKGSGNFGHAGRPGEVGGSGSGKGSKSEKDSSDAKQGGSRYWYDDGDFGMAPLIIDERDDKYQVKSLGDEQATRGLLGADSSLKEIRNLPYEKSIKGEKPTDKQKEIFQQVTGISNILKGQIDAMGDTMTFKDKKFDFEDFDRAMASADEFLFSARLKTVGDNTKVGKALEKALTHLSNITGVLKMIADPDMLKKNSEPAWYDIDDLIKRR